VKEYVKTLIKVNLRKPFIQVTFWRDCVGIEPTRPHTVVSSSFEVRGMLSFLVTFSLILLCKVLI
jgi:hypothetical protein